MSLWALVVFLVGVVGLLLHFFDVFAWFAPWWGMILMFLAFGMLTRIWRKEKEGEKERLVERIQELEAQLQSPKQ
jgi:hypothetical protein